MDFYKNELPALKVVMFSDVDGSEKTAVVPASIYLVKGSSAPALLVDGVHYSWAELDSVNLPGAYRLTALTNVFTDTVGDCLIYINATSCVPAKRGYTVQIPRLQFNAGGDTVQPTVAVSSSANNRLRVTYSEAVVMTTAANGALNLANYSIVGPSTVTILSVSQVSDRVVDLVTSGMLAGTPGYDLTVVNVEDLDGNVVA